MTFHLVTLTVVLALSVTATIANEYDSCIIENTRLVGSWRRDDYNLDIYDCINLCRVTSDCIGVNLISENKGWAVGCYLKTSISRKEYNIKVQQSAYMSCIDDIGKEDEEEGKCMDRLISLCGEFAQKGYCYLDSVYPYCEKSCGICTETKVCDKPTIENGNISPETSKISSGDSYTLTCNGGYEVAGSDTIECTDGVLTDPLPSCEFAPCTAGNYMTDTGCVPCDENTYSDDAAESCTACSSGKIASQGSTDESDCYHEPCTAGNYMTDNGCVECGANSYSGDGALSCNACPAGKISSQGSTSEADCEYEPCTAGNYMTANGCVQCSANSYSGDGASSCTACPAGEMSLEGSTSEYDCVSERYCSKPGVFMPCAQQSCYLANANVDSFDECKSFCENTANCGTFTYFSRTGLCNAKTVGITGEIVEHTNNQRVSARMSCYRQTENHVCLNRGKILSGAVIKAVAFTTIIQCRRSCAVTAGCVAFTTRSDLNKCFLHSAYAGEENHPYGVSAKLSCYTGWNTNACMQQNKRFAGGNLGGFKTTSEVECKEKCAAKAGCVAFTMRSDDGNCYLKNNKYTVGTGTYTKSAVMSCF